MGERPPTPERNPMEETNVYVTQQQYYEGTLKLHQRMEGIAIYLPGEVGLLPGGISGGAFPGGERRRTDRCGNQVRRVSGPLDTGASVASEPADGGAGIR